MESPTRADTLHLATETVAENPDRPPETVLKAKSANTLALLMKVQLLCLTEIEESPPSARKK